MITVKWLTRKVKSLFKVNSKNSHPSFVILLATGVNKNFHVGDFFVTR